MWMSVSHFLRIIWTAYRSFSWSSPKSLEASPFWKIANHKPHYETLVVFSHWDNVLSKVMFSCVNMNELINLSCFSRAVDKSPPPLSTITITISLSPWLPKAEEASAAQLSNLSLSLDSLWLSIEAPDYWVKAGRGPGALQIAICQFHNSYEYVSCKVIQRWQYLHQRTRPWYQHASVMFLTSLLYKSAMLWRLWKQTIIFSLTYSLS